MTTKLEDHIRGLVDQFQEGRGFPTFSSGEQRAIALILDRIDLIRNEYSSLAVVQDLLDPDWLVAVRAIKAKS